MRSKFFEQFVQRNDDDDGEPNETNSAKTKTASAYSPENAPEAQPTDVWPATPEKCAGHPTNAADASQVQSRQDGPVFGTFLDSADGPALRWFGDMNRREVDLALPSSGGVLFNARGRP